VRAAAGRITWKDKTQAVLDEPAERPVASAALRFCLMLWQLRHVSSMLYDIITDVILLTTVRNRTWFYILLGSIFAADFVAVIRVHWYMMGHARKQVLGGQSGTLDKEPAADGGDGTAGAAGTASASVVIKPPGLLHSWGQLLQACYIRAAQANIVVGLLICLLLTVPVSLTLLLLVLTMPFITTWMALTAPESKGRQSLDPSLELMGCLDAFKVCNMRSFTMAVMESPVFLVYSTLGFLDPYLQGQYISMPAGLASLAANMLHIVLEAGFLREAFLMAGTFWGGVRRRLAVGLRQTVVWRKAGLGSELCIVLGHLLTFAISALFAIMVFYPTAIVLMYAVRG
jgi:hypothetical protein